MSHLPLLKPRPISHDCVTKPKRVAIAPRKRSYAGPFVFVNSSDNPEREEERRGNRRMVKRWAMLNRVSMAQTHTARLVNTLQANQHHSPSSHRGKCRLVTWDLATLEETEDPEISISQFDLTPNGSTPGDSHDIAVSIHPLPASLNDPFQALPVQVDPHTRDLLQFFLTGGGDESITTQARTSNFRRSIWPVILSSKAALYSLGQ